MAPPAPRDVLAAGVVVFAPGRRVLLVHRPRYDDWSFPKGKLDPGEHRAAAACREVLEETGLPVRLGLPLPSQRYPVAAGMKTVYYWTGRAVGDDDISGYRPNDEIDQVRWVGVDEAEALLTYDHDRATLADAVPVRRRTRPVVVLRHGKALPRDRWDGDDRERPLLPLGEEQAARLVPLLAAYGVERVVSSSSTRCVQTVQPFARAVGRDLETRRRLSEEDSTRPTVARVVAELLDDGRPVVLCTHRPVLPAVFDALGVDDPHLEAGEGLVVHLRGRGAVEGVERIP